MNDTAPNHPRRVLALGVLAVCVGLGLMSLAGGCARRNPVVAPPATLRLASAPVVPPASPKPILLSWVNAPGACLTDVWRVSATGYTRLARITNAPTGMLITNSYTVTNQQPYEFFRYSHPILVGHYPDNGIWRVNTKLLGIEQ